MTRTDRKVGRIKGTSFPSSTYTKPGPVSPPADIGTRSATGMTRTPTGATGGMLPQQGNADMASGDQQNAIEMQREQSTAVAQKNPRVANRMAPLDPIAAGTRRADLGTRGDETMPDTQQAWRGATQPTSSPPPQVKSAAQQTESANPLTGDGNSAPTGSTTDVAPPAPAINPGKALGATSRNPAVAPQGQDMASAEEKNPNEGENDEDEDDSAPAGGPMGGTGAYQKAFSSPTSKDAYSQGVRRLFGGQPVSGSQPKKPGLMKRIAPGSDRQPVDDAAA